MKKHGKRKMADYNNNVRKKQAYEYVNNKKYNDENSPNNEQQYSYPKKKKKKLLTDQLLKPNPHNSIIEASKESCGFIEKIMSQNEKIINIVTLWLMGCPLYCNYKAQRRQPETVRKQSGDSPETRGG